MDSRDYILRVIEQIGRFLIELRDRLLGGEAGTREVERDLRSVAQQAGLDLEVARLATPETLRVLVAPTGEVEPTRCWLYAETLYLDALNAELSGRLDRALDSYHKARALFSLVGPRGAYLVGFPESEERMREIDGRVAIIERGDDGPDGPGGTRQPGPRRRAAGRKVA